MGNSLKQPCFDGRGWTLALTLSATVSLCASSAQAETLLGLDGPTRHAAAHNIVRTTAQHAGTRFYHYGHGGAVRLLDRDWRRMVGLGPIDMNQLGINGNRREALQREAARRLPTLFRLAERWTTKKIPLGVNRTLLKTIQGLGRTLNVGAMADYAPPDALYAPETNDSSEITKWAKRVGLQEKKLAPWLERFMQDTASVPDNDWENLLRAAHAEADRARFEDSEAQFYYGGLRIDDQSGPIHYVAAANFDRPSPQQIAFATVPRGKPRIDDHGRPGYSYYHGALLKGDDEPLNITRTVADRGVRIQMHSILGLAAALRDQRFGTSARRRLQQLDREGIEGPTRTSLIGEGDPERAAWWFGVVATQGFSATPENLDRFLDPPRITAHREPRYGLILPAEERGYLRALYEELGLRTPPLSP